MTELAIAPAPADPNPHKKWGETGHRFGSEWSVYEDAAFAGYAVEDFAPELSAIYPAEVVTDTISKSRQRARAAVGVNQPGTTRVLLAEDRANLPPIEEFAHYYSDARYPANSHADVAQEVGTLASDEKGNPLVPEWMRDEAARYRTADDLPAYTNPERVVVYAALRRYTDQYYAAEAELHMFKEKMHLADDDIRVERSRAQLNKIDLAESMLQRHVIRAAENESQLDEELREAHDRLGQPPLPNKDNGVNIDLSNLRHLSKENYDHSGNPGVYDPERARVHKKWVKDVRTSVYDPARHDGRQEVTTDTLQLNVNDIIPPTHASGGKHRGGPKLIRRLARRDVSRPAPAQRSHRAPGSRRPASTTHRRRANV